MGGTSREEAKIEKGMVKRKDWEVQGEDEKNPPWSGYAEKEKRERGLGRVLGEREKRRRGGWAARERFLLGARRAHTNLSRGGLNLSRS